MIAAIHRVVRSHRLALLIVTITAGAVLLIESFRALNGTPFYGDHPTVYLVFVVLLLVTELRPMPSLTDDTELTASWALDILRALGCDEVQGFLLGRPQPADAVESLLRVGGIDLTTVPGGAAVPAR